MTYRDRLAALAMNGALFAAGALFMGALAAGGAVLTEPPAAERVDAGEVAEWVLVAHVDRDPVLWHRGRDCDRVHPGEALEIETEGTER